MRGLGYAQGPVAKRFESERDQAETSFTPALRWLLQSRPDILALSFVDEEGECVDYCSVLDPFDAKIAGAQGRVLLGTVRQGLPRHGLVVDMIVHGELRDVGVVAKDSEYALVLVTEPGALDESLVRFAHSTMDSLCREARITTCGWQQPLRVKLRHAVGWAFAPQEFEWRGKRSVVSHVLGRREDREAVYFRVQTEDGQELTLVRTFKTGTWTLSGDL